MHFNFKHEHDWPPLAWLAKCSQHQTEILVHHGRHVEIYAQWFCEAVWDGAFEQGGFDRTDIVFGSGGRLRGETLSFVSSASTCDRLQHIQIDKTVYISNSLVCLAAILDIEFDPWYPYYYEDMCSIGLGIDAYKPSILSNRGDVHLTYYRNLCWDGRQLTAIEKHDPDRHLKSFDEYKTLLLDALKGLQSNLSEASRRLRFSTLSTCSSGYDSLAVSVLAKQIDTHEAICVPQDRIDFNDSGVEFVHQLGMQPLVIERNAWRQTQSAEVSFIAGDTCGRDVWLYAANRHLNGRVLLTGYFGDAVWAEKSAPPPGRFFRSKTTGPAGLSLCEFRLQAGFIHCPVPFIGAQALQSSYLYTQNSEMQKWRQNSRYDRPIPRRIIEDAGIERRQFGTRKTATAIHLFKRREFDRFFAGTDSFRDYMRWIRQQSLECPPPASDVYEQVSPTLEEIEVPLIRQLFPWAVNRCKKNYRPDT